MRHLTILALSFVLSGRSGLAFGVKGRTADTWLPDDVCAYLDVDINIPNLRGSSNIVGHLESCLCLSNMSNFCQSNVLPLNVSTSVEKKNAEGVIVDLIKQHAADANCFYPQHATPICIGDDPCGFDCTDGFVSYTPENTPCSTSTTSATTSVVHTNRPLSASATTSTALPLPTLTNSTTCICPAPKVVCNGICTDARTCPSQIPLAKRQKRWEGSGTCSMRGAGWMACGVFGGAARAWECINTNSDLESCGGCDIPLTPYTPRGTDCSALPGVADVSCREGLCFVRRCLPGWTVASDGSKCMPHGSGGRVVIQVPPV